MTGPLGDNVDAAFGLISLEGCRTGIVEISAAAGLRLIPRGRRNLMMTTSRGVGELIRAVLDAGATRVLVGCGDSGVNDGGIGLAQALGARFLDRRNKDLPPGGEALARLHRIDLSGLDPRIGNVAIEVCLNIRNMLLGRHGVSRVFGPQKGASPAQVVRLEAGMKRYSDCLTAFTGINAAALPGGGASGGLGAALHLLLGARLVPRYEFIERYIPLTEHIDWADLIVSAEGRIDRQTCRGKIPGEIARRAMGQGKPVIVLAGAIGEGADECYAAGIAAFASIIDQPYDLDQAIGDTRRLLQAGTESMMRMIAVGGSLSTSVAARLHHRRADD
ncbi:glycerate kinase family protein [Pseudorhodoplanes sp.]|uniref:glycerate kinase family protein n=1 Tax=Pseudorhodoplanes sp. TaxID=1934341 RepID=UPI003D10F2C5